MGNLDQTLPGSIDKNLPDGQDILGIKNLGIEYNTLDLKDLSQEEIKNIQVDIQSELKNPGVDLTQRIQAILELTGIKSTFAKTTNAEGKSLSISTSGDQDHKEKSNRTKINEGVQKANDAIKALVPGLIESLTKDIKLTDLTEQQKDLIATQQGTTPEKIDLTSPATQSLIEVFAIDKNRDQIREVAIKSGESSQEVQDIFTTWGMKMNEYQIPVSGSIDNSLKGIPKKIAEPVKSTYQEIVGDKTPPTVTRTGDRLTFSDPRNERYSYEIDMSKQPPRLAKTLNGLSISRDVVGLSPEQKEKKAAYETAKGKLDKSERGYAEGINDLNRMEQGESTIEGIQQVKGANGENIPKKVNIYSSVFLVENQAKESEYIKNKTELLTEGIKPEDRDKKFDTIIETVKTMRSNNLQNLLNTGETENHGSIDKMLESRIQKLNQLQKTNKDIITAKVEISKNPENTENEYGVFDKNTQSTLSYLSHIGYDELGQGTLDQVITAINIEKRGTIAEIDLSKNPKLDTAQEKELLRCLAQLSRKSLEMATWQGVDVGDEHIAIRQMGSPNWRTSLQDIQKTTSFQQMKGANSDVFTGYLYEKPETKTPPPPKTQE